MNTNTEKNILDNNEDTTNEIITLFNKIKEELKDDEDDLKKFVKWTKLMLEEREYKYIVAFTPPCNKDIHQVRIIQECKTKEEAKEHLYAFVKPAKFKDIEQYNYKKQCDPENNDDCKEELCDHRIMIFDDEEDERYVFDKLEIKKYEKLGFYGMIHPQCGASSLWILKVPTTKTVEKIMKELRERVY